MSSTAPTDEVVVRRVLDTDIARRDDGLRFARRVYLPRVLGLALGLPAALAVLWQTGRHPYYAVAITAYCLLWPHIAYRLARRSSHPRRVERRNLVCDSAAGGVTIAMIDFALLPTVLFVAMLAMDKLGAGGFRLFWKGLAAQALACAITAVLFGAVFHPETTILTVMGCIPLLVGYPGIVGHLMYGLARRINARHRALAEASRLDELTGYADRVHWQERVARELKRSDRTGRRPALLLVQIDAFDKIARERGAACADDVVLGVADILRRRIRAYDTPGRRGPDSFGVLMPETDPKVAVGVADRLRREIEAATFGFVDTRCTVSIGIASPEGLTVPTAQTCIAEAEHALRTARSEGGNWVVTSWAAEREEGRV